MVNVAVKVHVPPSIRFLLLGVYSSHFDEHDEFRHAPHVQHDEQKMYCNGHTAMLVGEDQSFEQQGIFFVFQV